MQIAHPPVSSLPPPQGRTLDCLRRLQDHGDHPEPWAYLERKVRSIVAGRLSGRRLPPDTDVEDLVQIVLVHIVTSIAVFRVEQGASFSAWVQTVLHRKLIGLWRQARRLKRGRGRALHFSSFAGENIAPQVADDREPAPSTCARLAELEGRLRACLGALRPRHRQVIELRETEGLPFQAVAERLGFQRATTARSLYFRASEERRRLLSDAYDRVD